MRAMYFSPLLRLDMAINQAQDSKECHIKSLSKSAFEEIKIDFLSSQSPEILAAELDKVVALPKFSQKRRTNSFPNFLTTTTSQELSWHSLILFDINKHVKECIDDGIQKNPLRLTRLPESWNALLVSSQPKKLFTSRPFPDEEGLEGPAGCEPSLEELHRQRADEHHGEASRVA